MKVYPLEHLVRIKNRRLEEAERVLKEKKEELLKEEERKKKLEEERNQTFNHKQDKIRQLRETLDEGTTSDKIKMMKTYIAAVDDELKQKEKKVQNQIKMVQTAEEKVEEARKDLYKKQQDVEKLKMHRKEWEKEMKALMEFEEAKEADELGCAMHNIRKKE
jgi:flagellar biosynthesis chaperone FliJ